MSINVVLTQYSFLRSRLSPIQFPQVLPHPRLRLMMFPGYTIDMSMTEGIQEVQCGDVQPLLAISLRLAFRASG
jgi:hypothetical protein